MELLMLMELLRMVIGLYGLRDLVLAVLWLRLRWECEGRWVMAISILLVGVLVQRVGR